MEKIVYAGQTALVEWQVENDHPRITCWSIKIKDTIRQVDPGDPKQSNKVELIIPQVASGEKISGSYRCYFNQRGKYIMGPATVSTNFPLGLVSGTYKALNETEVYVGPRIGRLTPVWHQRVRSLAAGTQSAQRRRGLEQDQFYALRPWKSGDSISSIHWRSSAKLGDLIVKQYDQQGDRDFALLFDCWCPPTSDDGNLPQELANHTDVESGASCTATILAELEHFIKGQVAVALCGNESKTVVANAQSQLLSDVMKELAIIKPSSDNKIETALFEMASAASAGTPLIVISTRPRPDFAEMDYGIEAALNRTDWIQVGTSEFDELFTLDMKQQKKDLVAILKADEPESGQPIPAGSS